jgi:hypothetical protein
MIGDGSPQLPFGSGRALPPSSLPSQPPIAQQVSPLDTADPSAQHSPQMNNRIEEAGSHDVLALASAWARLQATEQRRESEYQLSARFEFHGGRPFAVIAASADHRESILRVQTDVCPDDLPISTCWEDAAGCLIRRVELPGSVRGELSLAGSVHEEQHLTIQSPGMAETTITVVMRGQLPRRSRLSLDIEERDDADSQGDTDLVGPPPGLQPDDEVVKARQWEQASEQVEQLIDQHLNFVHRMFDTAPVDPAPTASWQGVLGGVCLRRLSESVEEWQNSAGTGEPQMALIVQLARDLPDVLASVCRRPRHVLRRERQSQSLGRVREVDSGCLRWLARQPGLSVAEKAGARQRVLAIVRVESIDTLENRLVRDLLLRAMQACRRYRREHRAAATHARVRQVRVFQQLLRRLLKESPVADAGELGPLPQPNYVLQFDSRYRLMWDAWRQLVRQQQLEDNVWRWRHRLFAEHVRLSVMSALNDLSDPRRTHGGDVLFQREQDAGQFVDSRTACGPVWLSGNDGCVDPVRGDQCHLHPLIPHTLAECGPDLVLLRRELSGLTCEQSALAGIWSVLDFDLDEPTESRRLSELTRRNETPGNSVPLRTLLIQPLLQQDVNRQSDDDRTADTSSVQAVEIQREQGRCLRLTLPLQQHMDLIRERVKWALHLT